MPLPLSPIKKVYEEHAIDTYPGDPQPAIYTEPLNTVSHRKEYFSLPIISNAESGQPHVQRMNK